MNSIAGKANFVWMQVDGDLLSADTTIDLKSGHAARAPNDGYNRLLVYDHGNYPGNPLEAYWQGAAEIFSYTAAPDTGSDQITGVTRGVIGGPVNFTDTGGDYRIVLPWELIDAIVTDDAIGVVVTSPRYSGGADKTGATASTAAINAAADTAAALGLPLVFPAGTYDIDGAITIHGPVIASGNAILSYSGATTGTAVTIRHTSGGANKLTHQRYELPRIQSTVAAGTSVGLKLINLEHAHVDIPEIEGFDDNLHVLADSADVTNIHIRLGDIVGWENIGIYIDGANAGDGIDDVHFYGGLIESTVAGDESHIKIGGTATTDIPARIVFDQTRLVGDADTKDIKCYGRECQFRNPQWRNGGTIDFDGSGATGSRIFAGTAAHSLVITQTNSASDNVVDSATMGTLTDVTISGGAITLDGASRLYKVIAESGGPTDDLDTINGPWPEGTVICLRPEVNDTITIKDGTGNIQCDGDKGIVGDELAMLVLVETTWYLVQTH